RSSINCICISKRRGWSAKAWASRATDMSGLGGGLVALIIRPLTAQDLSEAGRIIHLGFGTFLGAPEPEQFWMDMDYTNTHWRADPTATFGAELDGELVGSNFATRWGSVGLFGPVSVRPDLWDQAIGQRLMEPVMECFRCFRKHAEEVTEGHFATPHAYLQ